MRILFLIAIVLVSDFIYAQDSLKTLTLNEVTIYATRANENTPTTYSTINKEELAERNLGQDLPILLNFTPSLISTSDAGAGIGYTGLRIRGSDATRINVTINGIPINDSESHGVFWVNMPDLSSSVASIQIQRGIGTSSNGAASFGGAVNIQTSNVAQNAFFQTDNTVGSFNTWKSNVTYNTGLINDVYNFEARLSKIISDGYIDRSAANLKSYYLSGGRFGKKTMIKAVIFGGQEITQQSWYGTPEARLSGGENELQQLINFSGEYTTAKQLENLQNGGRKFNYYLYDNEIDNYRQDHYQLHLGHTVSDALTLSGAIHYTRGRGFFEQFRENDKLIDYDLENIVIGSDTISNSDIIRRRWLDNHFYGATYSFNYIKNKWDLTLGGAWNTYSGDHFGEIIWAQYTGNIAIRDRYYSGNGVKKDFNSFLKINYQFNENFNFYGDLQVRKIDYKTKGVDSDLKIYNIATDFTFFNPKVGLTYILNNTTNIYASYSVGNREPVRSDLIDANEGTEPKHETLHNIEIGIKSKNNTFSYQVNFYRMDYKNQLVVTGAINNVGAPVRINVPTSYRMGIELVGAYQITKRILWAANLTLSKNKIDEFSEIVSASFSEISHIDSDISFSPNIIGGSNLKYTPISRLTLQLLSKYVGKQFLDNTSNPNRAIKGYITNDLRMAYNFKFRDITEIKISILINNILNEKYSSNGYTWGYYYGNDQLYQQNNYYPQAGRNFLVSLSLKI